MIEIPTRNLADGLGSSESSSPFWRLPPYSRTPGTDTWSRMRSTFVLEGELGDCGSAVEAVKVPGRGVCRPVCLRQVSPTPTKRCCG